MECDAVSPNRDPDTGAADTDADSNVNAHLDADAVTDVAAGLHPHTYADLDPNPDPYVDTTADFHTDEHRATRYCDADRGHRRPGALLQQQLAGRQRSDAAHQPTYTNPDRFERPVHLRGSQHRINVRLGPQGRRRWRRRQRPRCGLHPRVAQREPHPERRATDRL